MAEREIKRWVTWHGRRIPIYEGESKADVAARIKGGLKEGTKKGRDTQEKQHAANVKSKKEALDKARKKSNEKGRKWADNPTERRKQAYQKAVDDAQKASKDFSDAYDGKVKAKFHKKGESDHDKAVEFFAKKEGISKEKAANMVKNMNPETVKKIMAKGDMKKTEYKSEPSKFNVEDYKKKVASDSDFYAKVAGIKSKKMVDKEKAEKKGSKVEDVGHGLRKFQTADGRTLYKDASGHWVKKADAEARLKGSGTDIKKMPYEDLEKKVSENHKKLNSGKLSKAEADKLRKEDHEMMQEMDRRWNDGEMKTKQIKASKKEEESKGSKAYSQADFDKEFGKDMAKDSGLERPGTKITSIHVPDDDENPYLGVEYSDGKTYVYGAAFDRPVDKDTMKKMVSAPARSEDEAVKEKQIANASKQKADLNKSMNSKEENVFTVAQDINKDGKATTTNKDIVKAYKANGSYSVSKNADGSYDIRKKGSEEKLSFQKDKKVKAPKFKPKTRDEIRKLPKEERHSYMTDASDKAFKETLKELGIKESELHLAPGYQKDKFRKVLEEKLDNYHADLSWDSADSKLGYHLAGNSGAIAWAYDQQTNKKNWQEVKMTPSQIKEHLRKTKGAKVYEEYKGGVVPYDAESLLKQKFGSSFSYHGIGSQSSVVENSVKLYRDKKGNLKLAKHSLTWD